MRSRPLVTLLLLLTLLRLAGDGVALATQVDDSIPVATPAASMQPIFGIIPLDNDQGYNIAVTLDPGASATLGVGVVNGGAVPVELRTYAANALTLVNGGFGASEEATALAGAATWLTYPSVTFTLAAGERWQQPLAVTVPPDAAPGEYVAALVAQTADSLPMAGTEMFRQIIRSAMRITIRVPGPEQPRFSLGEPAVAVEESVTSLEIPIENSGNVRLKPAGDLVITNADGAETLRSAVAMGSVFAGDATTIRIPIPEQFPAGSYTVSLDLVDESTGARDTIEGAPIDIAAPEEAATFVVETASVTPEGDPVQYVDVAATMTNKGLDIPAANIMLVVARNGEEIERYPLDEGKVLPNGKSEISQRYIPVDGWEPGTWTFALEIAAVSGDTETVLATVEIPDEISVP